MVLYETCCTGWRPKETKRIKTDAELRDDDMKIILESFKRKMERMRRSKTKCC